MRTKPLLKAEPAKPSALLDANTAQSTGSMESRSLTLCGLKSSSGMSMMASVELAATTGSSPTISCLRFLGRV